MTDLVAKAISLGPLLREAGPRIERERRLPADVVDALAGGGFFRMLVPKSAGGLEVAPRTMLEVIEAVSRADSAAGWCVMVGATSGLAAAFLPADTAREMFASPSNVACGVFAPMGKGVHEDGGYRLDGRWSFASGCEHSLFRLVGFAVDGDRPEIRQAVLRAGDTDVIDTWDVSGLRGTGSHDLVVKSVHVDARWTVSLTGAPRETGALYRFPVFGLLALGVSAVTLGIARTAIDAFVELAASKKPMGGARTLRERELVQVEIARAEASLRAARALVLSTVDEVSQRVETGEAMTIVDKASLRLAASQAASLAAQSVDIVQRLAGSTSIYEAHPFARFHRDVHVATQHAMIGDGTLALAGRVLLGLGVNDNTL
jgi:alkylation response protein AidB-like acyl-CoA dehydrogenase